MRISYICYEDLSVRAAWTTHISEVVKSLRKLGVDVILFAPRLGKLKNDFDVRIVYVPTINVRLLNECLYYLLLFFYIAAYQIRFKADILYVREMLLCLPVALISRLFNVPHIIEVNGPVIEERKTVGISRTLIVLYKIFQRMNFAACDKIIIVSEYIRDYLKQYYLIPDRKMVTILNGVNTELFRPLDKKTARSELGLSSNLYYITYVGSFYPHHALDYVVRVTPYLIKRLDSLKILLVGDGHVKSEIKVLAEELGVIDHIQFFESVYYEDVPSFINASDLCLMLYLHPDKEVGCPLKLLEYLSCGIPVIVNWKAFGGEPFEREEIGIKLDLHNMEDAATRLLDLLNDETLRMAMGKRARKFIEDGYSWHRTAKGILEVCHEVRQASF